MNDYRNKMCLLDEKYLAKCVSQDFITEELTFEIEPDGQTFIRQGEFGVEVYLEGEPEFDDIKHLLPRIKE